MLHIFFFFENRNFYEICGKVFYSRQARDDNIIRRMRIACWTPKAKTRTWNM